LDTRYILGKNTDGSPFEGDSLDCVEPRLYQCVREHGWIVTGMTLLWRGEGPNPFPIDKRNPGDRMKSCPSCEANSKSILAGVHRQ
jgi:hypothetical protein